MMSDANNNRRLRRPGSTARPAFSLLELIAALVVVSLILVPTATLMHQVLQGEATQATRAELVHLASGKQAECAHLMRVQFRNRNYRGNFRSEGQPRIRYEVTCSQAPGLGGVPGRLMAIDTLVWHDENRNRRPDADELSTRLWTTVSRATR